MNSSIKHNINNNMNSLISHINSNLILKNENAAALGPPNCESKVSIFKKQFISTYNNETENSIGHPSSMNRSGGDEIQDPLQSKLTQHSTNGKLINIHNSSRIMIKRNEEPTNHKIIQDNINEIIDEPILMDYLKKKFSVSDIPQQHLKSSQTNPCMRRPAKLALRHIAERWDQLSSQCQKARIKVLRISRPRNWRRRLTDYISLIYIKLFSDHKFLFDLISRHYTITKMTIYCRKIIKS